MKPRKNNYFKRLAYLLIVWMAWNIGAMAQQGTVIKTLVIDPGHGGNDPGAIGLHGHKEAQLALAVSLKFGELIEKNFPNIKVIFTRKSDKFVSLNDRAEIANKAKADLFFCIHLNAAENRSAYGSSTYALGLHRSEENLAVAKRENAVIELEVGGAQNYDFNPNSPEGHIIMSMKQNAFLDQSLKIAAHIEEEQVAVSNRKSRGVKQAGFYVLYKTSMPSILTEIGFISNPTEEAFLASENGQQLIALSLFRAFNKYKNEIEGGRDVVDITNLLPKEKIVVNEKNEEATQRDTNEKKETAPNEQPTAPKSNEVANNAGETFFRVQFVANTSYPKNRAQIESKFGSIITEQIANGITRFMIGDFSKLTEAKKAAESIRSMGFAGAFITAYENGQRVSNKRLSELLQ